MNKPRSGRIARWENLGIRNTVLHLVRTSRLPCATIVLKSTAWVDDYAFAGAKPYHSGEYLIQGNIPASLFLLSDVSVYDIPPFPECAVINRCNRIFLCFLTIFITTKRPVFDPVDMGRRYEKVAHKVLSNLEIDVYSISRWFS